LYEINQRRAVLSSDAPGLSRFTRVTALAMPGRLKNQQRARSRKRERSGVGGENPLTSTVFVSVLREALSRSHPWHPPASLWLSRSRERLRESIRAGTIDRSLLIPRPRKAERWWCNAGGGGRGANLVAPRVGARVKPRQVRFCCGVRIART